MKNQYVGEISKDREAPKQAFSQNIMLPSSRISWRNRFLMKQSTLEKELADVKRALELVDKHSEIIELAEIMERLKF